MPACVGGILQIDLARANWRRSTAPSPPRGGGRAGVAGSILRGLRRRPLRQSGWPGRGRSRRGRRRCCHLPPSAPVRPSTISSGSGGTAPICQIAPTVADHSTSSAPRKNDRHSSPHDVVVGADIFVAGMADQHRARHQFVEPAAAMAAETALAHIGDRVARNCSANGLSPGPACSGIRTPKCGCAQQRVRFIPQI